MSSSTTVAHVTAVATEVLGPTVAAATTSAFMSANMILSGFTKVTRRVVYVYTYLYHEHSPATAVAGSGSYYCMQWPKVSNSHSDGQTEPGVARRQ